MEDKDQKSYHKQRLAPTALESAQQESLLQYRLIQKMMGDGATARSLAGRDIHFLNQQLNVAMELELSTIPPYLCALYSLMEGDSTKPDYKAEFGDNAEAAYLIRSVMMEEMLHFTLVGNVINAINGTIRVTDPHYIPEYPTALPDSAGLFEVGLRKFSKEAIRTFLRIEQPTPPDTPPLFEGYQTIGQFYDAIKELMTALETEAQKNGDTIFKGDQGLQIDNRLYYGGGGAIISVHDLDSAMEAFDVILEQGEGSQTTIYDQDEENFGQIRELAHYFKFNEIYEEQRYASCQNDPKEPPDGEKLHIKHDKVYNMMTNPKTEDFVTDELKALSNAFNMKYSQLLHALEDAFCGQQEKLMEAVGIMYELRYQAVALMRNPIPGKEVNAGPTFEYFQPPVA